MFKCATKKDGKEGYEKWIKDDSLDGSGNNCIGYVDVPYRFKFLTHLQSGKLVDSSIQIRITSISGMHGWFVSRSNDVAGSTVTFKYAFKPSNPLYVNDKVKIAIPE